jgi:hypothetical protein
MKLFLLPFVVCVACAMGAAGQVRGASISAEPQIMSVPEHTSYATVGSMGTQHDLMGHYGMTSVHGERALWELMPEPVVTPLGDSAREIRKEHEKAKKAVIVWRN